MNIKHNFSLFFILINVIYINTSIGQTQEKAGLKFIKNYTPKEYGTFHNQNWAITQDDRGEMYFGNHATLLHYNGNDWQSIDIPNLSVKSLAKDKNGKIYVGSDGDFGYLAPNSKGEFVFISLVNKLPESLQGFAEVWATYAIENVAYFCTAVGVYKFENNKLIHFYEPTSENTFHKFYVVNNRFYLRENGVGILEEKDNKLILIAGSELFKDKKIDAFIPTNKGIFIATRNGELYNYFQKKFTRIIGSASIELLDADVYTSLLLHNGLIALGTLKKGIYIVDISGNLINKINIDNGLKVNRVHYLYEDKNNNIWAALEKGIALIEYFSPFTKFDETYGLEGNVNASIKFDNKLYVGTTQGLYSLNMDSKNKESFSPIINSDACNSFLILKSKNEQKLIVAMKSGLYHLVNQELNLIDENEFKILYQPTQNYNCFFAGGINSLSKYEFKRNGFEKTFTYANCEGKVVSMTSNKNELFIGSEGSGVYITNIDSKSNILGKINNSITNSQSTFLVFNIENKIIYATHTGFYEYKKINDIDSSVAINLIKEKRLSSTADIYRLKADHKNQIWMFYIDELNKKKLVLSYPDKKNNYVFKNENFSKINNQQVDNFYFENDSITWISSNDGLYKYNSATRHVNTNFKSFVSKVKIKGDSTIFLGVHYSSVNNTLVYHSTQKIQYKIPYNKNAITFEFAAAFFTDRDELYYKSYLKNFDSDTTQWTKSNTREFTNLDEGNYTLYLVAKNASGSISKQSSFEFTIQTPWYRTLLAYFLYLVFAMLSIREIVKYNTKRLKSQNDLLEKTVEERTHEIAEQKTEIEKSNNVLEQKNKDIEHQKNEITQSIEYAQHIQQSILPDKELIYDAFPQSFVLYKPKDIVSGDFYAFTQREQSLIIAAADCTGHGVPGALMSMLGSNILYQIINEKNITTPSDILYHLNLGVTESLKQNRNDGNDGMDIALCTLTASPLGSAGMRLSYSGAYRPLYLIRNGELTETKATKMPIGGHQKNEERIYANHEFELQKNDTIYLTTDGYADQFGGEKGKKLTTSKFKEILLSIQHLSMFEQEKYLSEFIENWRGAYEQVDDVCVIGIRV